MTDRDNTAPFSRPIAVSGIAEEPLDLTIEATAAERGILSEVLDLLGIGRLEADVRLTSADHGATIGLAGRISADVTQSCVVTLEPVESHIEATFERIYSARENHDDRDDIAITLDADEPVEPLMGDLIDVGAAVMEQLALEIDPFPRASGAEFSGYSSAGSGESGGKREGSRPFEVLSRLKRDAD